MRESLYWKGQHVFFGGRLHVIHALQGSLWEESGETSRDYLIMDANGVKAYIQAEEKDLNEAFWCQWCIDWVESPNVGGNGTTHYYTCPACEGPV